MMKKTQQTIIDELHVKPVIDCEEEVNTRVAFLKDYLLHTGKKGYVLAISGGQDSALAGRLAQLAVQSLRDTTGASYQFIAVRLPYGVQRDEADAQLALEFIQPDTTVTVNIQEAVDASIKAFTAGTGEQLTEFLKGNNKARERMKVQYDLGAFYDLIVIGTDHAAEAVTGFFTKYGDGGADVIPLTGLDKTQGKMLLQFLGAPSVLYEKAPTADLRDDMPGRPDEDELGMTYREIDLYLEGKEVDAEIREKLEKRYRMTEHKRQLPVTPYDTWWRQ